MELFPCIDPNSPNSVQQILVAILPFKITLHLFTSPKLVDSVGVLPPLLWPANYLQAERQDDSRAHLTDFSLLRDYSPALHVIKYLNAMVVYILPSFLVVYYGRPSLIQLLFHRWKLHRFLLPYVINQKSSSCYSGEPWPGPWIPCIHMKLLGFSILNNYSS